MNKRLIVSLAVIGAVAAMAVGGTIAYFSDTETSSGNAFVAGAFDLKVDSKCSYNGVEQTNCTWLEPKDLGQEDLFFNYDDIKPGDWGEDTISLHVENDAWMCAEIANLVDYENGCNEPEQKDDESCGEAGQGEGELQDNLYFTIWRDNGVGDFACNNKYDTGEQLLVVGQPAANGLWPIADSSTGTGFLAGGQTHCIGIAWSVPTATGNIIQGDGLKGDVVFSAYQARNVNEFYCAGEQEPECSVDADCDDGNECTADTCNAQGLCEYSNLQDGSLCSNGTCQAGICEEMLGDIVLNEVFYDAIGEDPHWVFIELFGPANYSLDNFHLVGINGNGGNQYMDMDLSGKQTDVNGYFLIVTHSADASLNAIADMIDNNVDLQNGGDSVLLKYGTAVMDTLGYGSEADYYETAAAPDVNPGYSLSRSPTHTDTDNNLIDFHICTPTPKSEGYDCWPI